jgi:phenylpropionate dioxygenase-like ring-hydroxylating dioxygenase large terminal subunit
MFHSTHSSRRDKVHPRHSLIKESDWHILASFWHPIAFVHELGPAPMGARLLDVDLVIYHTSAGVSVAYDIRPHRGTRLGKIIDDMLVCPMHGLGFDGNGQCKRIPSSGEHSARIPASFGLSSIKAEIRYGIVWASLSGEPIWPLPRWEARENPELRRFYFPPDTWKASAGRHVENFNDLAHFPWVHVGSFGGCTVDPVPDYEVEHTDYGLTFWVPYTEGFNRFPGGIKGDRRDVIYRYQLTFPLSTLPTIEPKGSTYAQYFADAVCLVSAHESRIFQLSMDTTGSPDAEFWLRDAETINREDRPLAESQRPQDLPLNIRDEMHIPADRMSVEYRRALVSKFGLGANSSTPSQE